MGTYYIPDELVIRISKLGLDVHSFIKKSLMSAVEIEENKKEVKT